jgi:heterodisulfide reductase subunit A
MVILSVGLEPQTDSKKLTEILELNTTPDGWFQEENHIFQTEKSIKPGIYLAGACQGPKDIPDSVLQASAVASKVIQSIMNNNIRQIKQHLSTESISAITQELISTNSD